jgi:copper transport protein
VKRAVIAAVVALGAVSAMAAPVRAHAALVSSDPAAGAELDSPPAAIALSFTEPPDPELSVIEVLDATGTAIETGATTRGAGNLLRTALPPALPDGVYTVSWRVVSEADGHLTAGAFAFGLGEDPGSAPPIVEVTTPGPSLSGVAGRVLLYAGVAVLIAAAVVGGLAFGGRLAARRPLLLAASGSLAVGIGALVWSQASVVGVGIVDLFGSRAGRPYAVLSGVGIVAVASGINAALGSGRSALALAGVGAAAAALVRAIGGHAAAAPTPAPAIAIQWIHVVAVSTWIGGLVLLALRARTSEEGLAADARRFSRIAVIAAPAAVVTGSLRAAAELGGIGWFLRAFDTSYGTMLAVKVSVVGGLLALGAFNRFRGIGLLSASRLSPLRRAVSAEVALAAVVLGLTGTITSLAPRPEAPAQAGPVAAFARNTDFAATVEIRLRASPGTPGPNRFVVRLFDPGSGQPLEADAVSLRFEPLTVTGVPESSLDLEPDGTAWSGRGTNLSLAGTWEVRATVLRGADGVGVPLALTTVASLADLTTTETSGLPTLTTATLADGVTLQAYLDPSVPGISQAHVTAFDPTGSELPLDAATFVAFAPDSTFTLLTPERFGEGHFVAPVTLSPGRWRFALTATTTDGRVLQMPFSRSIGRT